MIDKNNKPICVGDICKCYRKDGLYYVAEIINHVFAGLCVKTLFGWLSNVEAQFNDGIIFEVVGNKKDSHNLQEKLVWGNDT